MEGRVTGALLQELACQLEDEIDYLKTNDSTVRDKGRSLSGDAWHKWPNLEGLMTITERVRDTGAILMGVEE